MPLPEEEAAGALDVAEVARDEEEEDRDAACEDADEAAEEADDTTDDAEDNAELATDDAEDATDDADDTAEEAEEALLVSEAEAELDELAFKQALLEPAIMSKGALLLVRPAPSRICRSYLAKGTSTIQV